MNNKSISDFVAATMDAVLNSPEHKALFRTAEDENDAKKETCEDCDELSVEDSSCGSDECEAKDSSCDTDETECDVAKELSAAWNVAIDSLITASAALDSLGMEKSAGVSLKLASFIVEAKKVEKDSKDSKKPAKKDEKKVAPKAKKDEKKVVPKAKKEEKKEEKKFPPKAKKDSSSTSSKPKAKK